MTPKPIFMDEKHQKAREYFHKRMLDPEFRKRTYEQALQRRLSKPKKTTPKEPVIKKPVSSTQEAKYEWRRRNLEKMRAEVYAFRHVPLKPKCEVCGGTEGRQKHHPDYTKPLLVITLCKKCHRVADKIRKLSQVDTQQIVLTERICSTCNLTYPQCGKSRPLLQGKYGCAMWVQKVERKLSVKDSMTHE